MHGNVILEVEYQEVGNDQYSQMFIDALRDRFNKYLPEDQLCLLAPVIEQAREAALNPVDLAQNLVDNWSAILGSWE